VSPRRIVLRLDPAFVVGSFISINTRFTVIIYLLTPANGI
jgi:hypothetical protein